MATGGVEYTEMDPIGDARNYPLPKNYNREFGETSFSNLGFDDATTYNTSDNSNLSDANNTSDNSNLSDASFELRERV